MRSGVYPNAFLHVQQAVHQPVVIGRIHDAEPDILAFQCLEGGAVPDHQLLVDGFFEHIEGGDAFLLDAGQDEVGVSGISL